MTNLISLYLALAPSVACTVAEPTIAKVCTPQVLVGDISFPLTLSDNDTSRAFRARLPLVVTMADLNANEKHTRLDRPLPSDAARPGRIMFGDLMLYGDDTLVLFYSAFDTSYRYTRIGAVAPAGLAAALGAGDASVTFTCE